MLKHPEIGDSVVKWCGAGLAEGAAPMDLSASSRLRADGTGPAGGAPCDTPASPGLRAHRTGPVTFVLSTDEVDRHGDLVSADGWRLEAYRRNPVLLWAHDYRRPAIGRAVALWTEPHRLLAKIEFASGAFAQEVASLYAEGFQWGVSVGFRPLRWEERRDPRTGVLLGLRYLEQELLEVSAVPVPANRNALRRENSPPPQTIITVQEDNAQAAGIHWQTIALGALLAELGAGRTAR